MFRSALFLAMASLTCLATAADTAYVKPSSFAPALDQTISVEVAFNDYCCEPRYALRTDTFTVIEPDGTRSKPDRVKIFADMTVLEHRMTTPGTTRITTGERLGRKGEYVLLDGTYHLVNSRDAEPIHVPDGTPILSSQTATVTDAYVTVGAQDWGALRTKVGRLSIEPALHPSSVRVGSPFIARVMMDGAPIANETVSVFGEVDRLHESGRRAISTDKDGLLTVSFENPGLHIIMVRLQAPAPVGAETDIRSYTTALALTVAPD